MINFNAPIILAGAAVKTTLSLMAPVLVWGMFLASFAVPAVVQANDSGRGRHKQLYAVPAPGTVVIGGQLDDWDLSGQVEMFVIQATRGTMNAKFAVMYDADAIYLGADLNDPSPMMNMREPVRVLVTQHQGKPLATLYFPMVKDFQGEPTVFNSPTGNESFDEIRVLENVASTVEKTDKGFRAQVKLPLESLRLELRPSQKLKMDLGYIFGNAQGIGKAVRRAYLSNNSFAANVVDDIPNESRLEPKEWSEAVVE